MDAENIVKLSPEAVQELLNTHQVEATSKEPPGQRKSERWPFPGAVEVWLPDDCYGERHILATMHNLSSNGMAMRARRPVPVDTRISVAIHEPKLSCYGHAIVRHCTRAPIGYLIGLEFVFWSDEEEGQ